MFLSEFQFNYYANLRDEREAAARGIISRYGSIEAWPVPVDFQTELPIDWEANRGKAGKAGTGILAGRPPLKKPPRAPSLAEKRLAQKTKPPSPASPPRK